MQEIVGEVKTHFRNELKKEFEGEAHRLLWTLLLFYRDKPESLFINDVYLPGQDVLHQGTNQYWRFGVPPEKRGIGPGVEYRGNRYYVGTEVIKQDGKTLSEKKV